MLDCLEPSAERYRGRSAAYRSGITVQKEEPAAALLPFVLRDFVRHDEESLQRRKQQWREREVRKIMRSQELADQNLLVRTAAEHFETHPAEAYPWYRRARYALELHARCLSQKIQRSDMQPEAVALWEFVGRTVPMRTIAHVLAELGSPRPFSRLRFPDRRRQLFLSCRCSARGDSGERHSLRV